MKTIVLLAVVVLLSGGIAIAESPIPPALETITVPADGTLVQSSTVLEEGVEYWILSEGTYRFGYPGEHWADAEWAYDVYGGIWDWYEEREDDSNLDLVINGEDRDWWGSPLDDPDPIVDFATFHPHVFSPSHKYWTQVIGEGSPIPLHIADIYYPDNSGSLTASIYPVPEPATLSLLACAGLLAASRRRQ